MQWGGGAVNEVAGTPGWLGLLRMTMRPAPASLIQAGLTRLDFHKFQTVPIPNSSVCGQEARQGRLHGLLVNQGARRRPLRPEQTQGGGRGGGRLVWKPPVGWQELGGLWPSSPAKEREKISCIRLLLQRLTENAVTVAPTRYMANSAPALAGKQLDRGLN